MKQNLVIFDLDDTLLNTSDLYYQCQTKFTTLLTNKINYRQLQDIFENYDNSNIDIFGYAPWRYSFSMAETYMSLVKKEILPFNANELITIINIGKQIEVSVPKPIEGADELLKTLKNTYRLALLTRGEISLQMKKICHYGWDQLFDYISVVPYKSTEQFKKVIHVTSTQPHNAWSIGNSLYSDVLPAKELGLSAILYQYKHPEYEWKHEIRNSIIYSAELADYRVDELIEILSILLS